MTGISSTTIKRWRKQHPPLLSTSKKGRPSKLSPQDVRHCIRKLTSGETNSAANAAKMLDRDVAVKVHRTTVSRALHAAGLGSGEKVDKPHLQEKNIRGRLLFAKKYKDWTMDDWKRVIWSDESKINRFGSDGRCWYWKRDNESVQPHHINQTVKHGGGSIMIWGCMTWHGPGYMCKLDGTVNQELYLTILQDELLKTIEYYEMEASQVIFQQDNAKCHTARRVREWLEEQRFSCITDWPAQSPDLCPIEHLWAHVKRRLNQSESPAKGMNELWERIQAEWEKIPVDTCQKLIESMPSRIYAVIKAKGRWTKY